MVCVPCFIIPVLLFVWHRFIQPIVLRYWNPWAVKDKDGKIINKETEFPFQCAGGKCPFPIKNNTKDSATISPSTTTESIASLGGAGDGEGDADSRNASKISLAGSVHESRTLLVEKPLDDKKSD